MPAMRVPIRVRHCPPVFYRVSENGRGTGGLGDFVYFGMVLESEAESRN